MTVTDLLVTYLGVCPQQHTGAMQSQQIPGCFHQVPGVLQCIKEAFHCVREQPGVTTVQVAWGGEQITLCVCSSC